jgi:DNA-binding beta-propeller fold protein YncE
MITPFTRRTLLKAQLGLAAFALPTSARAQPSQDETLLLTNPATDSLTFLEGDTPEAMAIAPSPWGASDDVEGRVYISSAQYLTIVDTSDLTVVGSVAYRTPIETVGYGEYRSGGMGIAVTPDGSTVAVGIHVNGSNGVVELFDVASGAFVAAIPVGLRPFDVVASPDSRFVYSIDHDSFTITAIDLETLEAATIDAAPLGYGEFDKPHYAAVRSDGALLLPYVGRMLWILDPATGESSSLPMTSNTHQHGITLSDDESTAYVVGTGPAGPALGPPSLTELNIETGEERIIELVLPHEQVALSADGKTAILTGGYTFADGGWDGLTYIDLENGEIADQAVPGRPLAIRRLS